MKPKAPNKLTKPTLSISTDDQMPDHPSWCRMMEFEEVKGLEIAGFDAPEVKKETLWNG